MKNLRIIYVLAIVICLILIVSSASQQLRNEAELFKIAMLLLIVIFGFKTRKN